MQNIICPLCKSNKNRAYSKDKKRSFFKCLECELVFVPKEFFISEEAEKAEYDLHQNSPDDKHYRKFLSKIFDPLQKLLKKRSNGLDFGSGPGPTLSLMLTEIGHNMNIYDHFYANEQSVLEKQYDFITATEVIEHLHNPQQILDKLWSCLKKDGLLGIMTKNIPANQEDFSNWGYKRDLTHLCFYSPATFKWITAHWHYNIAYIAKDVIIFRKS